MKSLLVIVFFILQGCLATTSTITKRQVDRLKERHSEERVIDPTLQLQLSDIKMTRERGLSATLVEGPLCEMKSWDSVGEVSLTEVSYQVSPIIVFLTELAAAGASTGLLTACQQGIDPSCRIPVGGVSPVIPLAVIAASSTLSLLIDFPYFLLRPSEAEEHQREDVTAIRHHPCNDAVPVRNHVASLYLLDGTERRVLTDGGGRFHLQLPVSKRHNHQEAYIEVDSRLQVIEL